MATVGWVVIGAALGLVIIVVSDFVVSEYFDRALYDALTQ